MRQHYLIGATKTTFDDIVIGAESGEKRDGAAVITARKNWIR